jgi:hypothetical protein
MIIHLGRLWECRQSRRREAERDDLDQYKRAKYDGHKEKIVARLTSRAEYTQNQIASTKRPNTKY